MSSFFCKRYFRDLLCFSAAMGSTSLFATTYSVTSTADSGANTLRQALIDANANAGPNSITFNVGGTITLASPLPPIRGNLTGMDLNGKVVTLSGVSSSGFFAFPSATFSLVDSLGTGSLTLSTASIGGNGGSSGGGGALGAGGGIFVGANADITINNTSFSGCKATGGNGGSGAVSGGGGGGMSGGNGGDSLLFGGSTNAGGGGGFGAIGGNSGGQAGSLNGAGGGGGLLFAGGNGSFNAVGGGGGGGGGDAGAGVNALGPVGGAGGSGTTPANAGGAGGNAAMAGSNAGASLGGKGGTAGGGGGGGVGGGGSLNAAGGAAGFAGGGGGAAGAFPGFAGGAGGFGGGGGGGSGSGVLGNGGTGGAGGFGGGGGGSGNGTGGAAGFGGGAGSGSATGLGGGGGALGGAIFVANGATLRISGTSGISSSTVTAGTGANSGLARGQDIFLMSSGTIQFAHSNTVTVSGAIESDNGAGGGSTSTGGIQMSGTGILDITGNTGAVLPYTGSTAFDGGTTKVSSDANLGKSTNPISFNAGTLELTAGFTMPRTTTLNIGGGTVKTDSINATFSGPISGATGGLTKSGAGTLNLSGMNTYGGGSTIDGGALALLATNSINATGFVNVNGSGAAFDISGAGGGITIGDLIGVSGSLVHLGSHNLTFGTGNSTTFSGNIDGSTGGIVKQNGGTATFSGSNTYAGTTTISGGVLQISNVSALPAGGNVNIITGGAQLDLAPAVATFTIGDLNGVAASSVNLGSSNLIFGTATPSTTFAGLLIGGPGSVTKVGSGIAIFSGGNIYTGGTTIGNGTLQINSTTALPFSENVTIGASGAKLDLSNAGGGVTIGDLSGVSGSLLTLGANTLTFGTAVPSVTFAGDASGTGGLNKDNIGTAVFTGTNSVGPININAGSLAISGGTTSAGPINVNAGSLVVNASTTSSQTTVALGATLSGVGPINGPVTNNGTVSPGNSIGTMNIVGNYIQATGSTLLIEVSPSAADQLNITGTALIQPNATLALFPSPGTYPISNTYTIIQTTGGVTGTFANVPNNLPTIQFGVTYTANDVLLDVLISSFASIVSGGNPGSVAKYLDTLNPTQGSDLAFVMNVLRYINDSSDLRRALDQLHPAPYKDLILAQQKSLFTVGKGIVYRLNELLDTRCRTVEEKKQFALWSNVYGEWAEQANRHHHLGYRSTGGGAMLGADYCFTDHFVLGLTGAYSYNDVDIHKSRAEGHINSYYGALYAMLHNRHAYLDLAMIGGFDQFDASRKIKFSSSFGSVHRRAHTDHNGWDMDGHLDTGLILGDLDSGFVSPFISVDYLFVHEDGFRERGAKSINLRVRDTDDDMLRGEAGINFARCFKFKHGKWTPQARFSAIREERFADKHYRSNFVGEPGSFVVTGLYPDRTLFSPGAGVTGMFYDDKMSFSLNYDGEFGDGYNDQIARAEFSWGF